MVIATGAVGAPPPAITARTVGHVNYSGEHTWAGVVQVTADDTIYQDGVVTASVSGVPQGVTFSGDRKNITLKNLTFNGVGDGVNIGNNQRVDDLIIDNCKFMDCRSPDATSHDVLLGQRGIGIFGSRGTNWTIRNSVFKTKSKDPSHPEQRDCSAQYAGRLGEVSGLNVSQTRFENWSGKACVWLMFVRAAAFERTHFDGGMIRIGVRPNDMPGIEVGECRNIIFRDCTFNFGIFDDWPAAICVFPGCENIAFENCRITTVPDSKWWLEVDARQTRNIRWSKCTWNGKPVEGYLGVRSSMSPDEMKTKEIGPAD